MGDLNSLILGDQFCISVAGLSGWEYVKNINYQGLALMLSVARVPLQRQQGLL